MSDGSPESEPAVGEEEDDGEPRPLVEIFEVEVKRSRDGVATQVDVDAGYHAGTITRRLEVRYEVLEDNGAYLIRLKPKTGGSRRETVPFFPVMLRALPAVEDAVGRIPGVESVQSTEEHLREQLEAGRSEVYEYTLDGVEFRGEGGER
jgi:hypothetical protein